jgi:hypothetical protein
LKNLKRCFARAGKRERERVSRVRSRACALRSGCCDADMPRSTATEFDARGARAADSTTRAAAGRQCTCSTCMLLHSKPPPNHRPLRCALSLSLSLSCYCMCSSAAQVDRGDVDDPGASVHGRHHDQLVPGVQGVAVHRLGPDDAGECVASANNCVRSAPSDTFCLSARS